MPKPWQKLTYMNAHQRDAHIHFDEPTHKYYVNGSCKGNISCTGFIHEFFEHFDARAIIAKMKKSSTWMTSKYYGKTDKEIMEYCPELTGRPTNKAIEERKNKHEKNRKKHTI